MVARYKYKRLKEEQSFDAPPKALKLEGSERNRAKKEVRERLEEAKDLFADALDRESKWEEEMRLDYWCYQQQQADPNYVCRCFEPKEEEK